MDLENMNYSRLKFWRAFACWLLPLSALSVLIFSLLCGVDGWSVGFKNFRFVLVFDFIVLSIAALNIRFKKLYWDDEKIIKKSLFSKTVVFWKDIDRIPHGFILDEDDEWSFLKDNRTLLKIKVKSYEKKDELCRIIKHQLANILQPSGNQISSGLLCWVMSYREIESVLILEDDRIVFNDRKHAYSEYAAAYENGNISELNRDKEISIRYDQIAAVCLHKSERMERYYYLRVLGYHGEEIIMSHNSYRFSDIVQHIKTKVRDDKWFDLTDKSSMFQDKSLMHYKHLISFFEKEKAVLIKELRKHIYGIAAYIAGCVLFYYTCGTKIPASKIFGFIIMTLIMIIAIVLPSLIKIHNTKKEINRKTGGHVMN